MKTRHKMPPLRPGMPVAPPPIEYDPMLSGKEVLSVDTHPSSAAERPYPPDSDPHRLAFPECRRSPPATEAHTWSSSKGRAWILRSETADLRRSARILPRILPRLLI